ncbi:sensor histidine kinase [Brevibacillus borstelensis]|uniref:sensor histidine kinase n=1 Tax=Brevibacillus borstelensis TaxID=45462 RepID=UPI0030C213AC
MKNYPLAVQIWLIFASITMGVTLLLALLFPWALRGFFTKEVYSQIEASQEVFLAYATSAVDGWEDKGLLRRELERQNVRAVTHAIFRENGKVIGGKALPESFVNMVNKDIGEQLSDVRQYVRQVEDESIYYVIRREILAGKTVYLVSYVWDTYLNGLVSTLLWRLILIMGAVLLLSWLPCLWLARYLTRPLVEMEQRVKRIADRDWSEPFVLERADEIGRLAASIERMRERLVSQNEKQQSFLQQVSHELKTPVMVIRSYAQSILDGIFPKGDIPGSVRVIDDEAKRLEERIRGLLYITKLDFLEQQSHYQPFRLDELVEEVWDRLKWKRPDVDWSCSTEAVTLSGDPEQWKVVVENLLDNQMRYARGKITLVLEKQAGYAELRMGNDGPPIPETIKEQLFDRFSKGEKGEFGLGLAIVKRIVQLHQAQIQVESRAGEVAFVISVPVFEQ